MLWLQMFSYLFVAIREDRCRCTQISILANLRSYRRLGMIDFRGTKVKRYILSLILLHDVWCVSVLVGSGVGGRPSLGRGDAKTNISDALSTRAVFSSLINTTMISLRMSGMRMISK